VTPRYQCLLFNRYQRCLVWTARLFALSYQRTGRYNLQIVAHMPLSQISACGTAAAAAKTSTSILIDYVDGVINFSASPLRYLARANILRRGG
jgi:hypothetical protein